MSLQKEFVEQIGKETEHDIMYGRVGQLFTCMRMIELANTMIREKISEGDVRGIDGFDLIQEFYARKMHMAPNPGEAACTNLKNCAFTEYINDSLQDQRRMGTAIEKTLIPHSDYTPF